MKITKIKPNFIYPTIRPTDFKVGGVTELPSVPLRKDGDWRDYLPKPEDQEKYGVESSACYKEAQQHTIATIQEEKYGMIDENYSARFNDQENATPQGGSPTDAADSFRKDGLIPDSMLPFSDIIKSWEDFNSFKGGHEPTCRRTGKMFLENWKLNYHIVFEWNLPVKEKYKRLRNELLSGPVPVSVHGWIEEGGVYIKPEGVTDNHLVECAYLDEENCAYIWDTYEPYLKKLEPFYNFDLGMAWRVEKKEAKPEATDLGSVILLWIKKIIEKLKIWKF